MRQNRLLRQGPVWVDGEVVLFTASRAEADAKLLAEEKRMGAKR